MSEIADFLRARIAERRTLAEAAAEDSGMNWSPGDDLSSSVHETDSGSPVVIGPWEHLDLDVRRHIAASDPAAVIADCDAKLAVVDDLLAETHVVVEDPWYTCSAATEEHDGGRCCDEHRRGKPCDCGRDTRVNRRLAILAQPFAGHRDHKGEEWAP